jgi:tetratricopeptide (TPR) repeat protein
MKRILPAAFCLLVLLVNTTFGQASAQKLDDQKLKAAGKLIKESRALVKADDLVQAEKKYKEALDIHPLAIFFPFSPPTEVPYVKIKMGDYRGANELWEYVISALAKNKSIHLMNTVRIRRALANIDNGDINVAVADLLAVEKTGTLSHDDYTILSIFSGQLGDFETAERTLKIIEDFYKGKKLFASVELQPLYAEALICQAKGDNAKVVLLTQRLDQEDKGVNTAWRGVARFLKAEAYAALGDREKTQMAYDEALKHAQYSAKSPSAHFIQGLIAYMDKDYNKAIEFYNEELFGKKTFMRIVSGLPIDPYGGWAKFKYFTARAHAYLGLNDFIKARSDFETALLYNPQYQPAITGLANLEGKVVVARRADKTGPKIVLTEPEASRALKVVSTGSVVTIKGRAVDPSGIKTVEINGAAVYAQEDGLFWGGVTLKDGVNKVTIRATDIIGNSSEDVFQIEKQAAVSPDILPVTATESKNYALIIAAQNYEDSSIPSLENPVADAIKLKLTLKNNYSFAEENILTMFNPDAVDFRKKFTDVQNIVKPEDNLIIFYAGHGIWVEKEKKGYWLLTDAKRNDVNTWLENKVVLDMIAKVPSRHTLLITDACFSGSVFRTRSIGADAPPALREMSEKISRVAITSGNDTEVPDESVFMKYLVKALSENKEKYLTAQKMFINQIIEAVMTESKTEPRYGTLELAGHVGGDYIFTKK